MGGAARPGQPDPATSAVSDGRLGRPGAAGCSCISTAARPARSRAVRLDGGGARLRMAMNARMRRAAGAERVRAGARRRWSASADGALVHVAGGPSIACRLVVAAEGRRSRRCASRPASRSRELPYRQTGIVCAISHERPHHDTALEHFLPGGPFAQLPMAPSRRRGGRRTQCLGHRLDRAHAGGRARAGAGRRRASRAELARRLGGHLGAIQTVGRRWRYPLSAMLVHRYCRHAARAGRRCRAWHSSDRGAGAEPRFPRCDRAGRSC